MNDWMIFQIGLVLWVIGATVAAGWLSTVTKGNIARRAQMPRWRLPGAILGLGALLLTVPQAQALLWEGTAHYYLPCIILFAGLCYWKLDFLMARALAGLMMLAAYYFLYYSFALQAWMAPVGAVMSWIIGLAGIFIAGKPCWLRDYLHAVSRSRWLRMLSVVFLILTGIYALGAIMIRH